jgi:hypothetical protein
LRRPTDKHDSLVGSGAKGDLESGKRNVQTANNDRRTAPYPNKKINFMGRMSLAWPLKPSVTYMGRMSLAWPLKPSVTFMGRMSLAWPLKPSVTFS